MSLSIGNITYFLIVKTNLNHLGLSLFITIHSETATITIYFKDINYLIISLTVLKYLLSVINFD